MSRWRYPVMSGRLFRVWLTSGRQVDLTSIRGTEMTNIISITLRWHQFTLFRRCLDDISTHVHVKEYLKWWKYVCGLEVWCLWLEWIWIYEYSLRASAPVLHCCDDAWTEELMHNSSNSDITEMTEWASFACGYPGLSWATIAQTVNAYWLY